MLANINWLFTIDIKDMIGDLDPVMVKLLSRPMNRIREHASAMLKVIDDKFGEEFSEGFEDLSNDLKNKIYDYVKGNREDNF